MSDQTELLSTSSAPYVIDYYSESPLLRSEYETMWTLRWADLVRVLLVDELVSSIFATWVEELDVKFSAWNVAKSFSCPIVIFQRSLFYVQGPIMI
jgi:hypothetical protein